MQTKGVHRHRFFLEAVGKTGETVSHRPKQIHRTSAKHVLECLDKEVAEMSLFPGLVCFTYDKETWLDSEWEEWRHLYLAGDISS